MPDPTENVVFEPIEPPNAAGSKAKEESDQIESKPYEAPPNSVSLNLGKFCHIRWHAESGAPLFCFMSILVLLIFGLLIALLGACNSAVTWPNEVFKFLGQAVLTLVGAVVGASATGTSTTRSRKSAPPKS